MQTLLPASHTSLSSEMINFRKLIKREITFSDWKSIKLLKKRRNEGQNKEGIGELNGNLQKRFPFELR